MTAGGPDTAEPPRWEYHTAQATWQEAAGWRLTLTDGTTVDGLDGTSIGTARRAGSSSASSTTSGGGEHRHSRDRADRHHARARATRLSLYPSPATRPLPSGSATEVAGRRRDRAHRE
jgi:hypothetical protein